MLASPLGVRFVRRIVDDLVTLSQAEAYEVPGIIRRIENEAAADAGRRGALGFDLMDVIAGLQQVRAAIWKVLIDALVVGELPAFGETMQEMQQVDAFMDLHGARRGARLSRRAGAAARRRRRRLVTRRRGALPAAAPAKRARAAPRPGVSRSTRSSAG